MGVKEINPVYIDTKGTNINYRGAGRALRGQGKVISSVKPTPGLARKKEYMRENERKLAQAKIRLQAMQKVDKDVEAGYQSVKTKFKGGK